jgi:hypothetical protein
MKTNPDFIVDPDVDVRQARRVKHERGLPRGRFTYLQDKGTWHAKHDVPDHSGPKVSQCAWWIPVYLALLRTSLFCDAVSQHAGLYDYRRAKFHVSRTILDLADLGSAVKRQNSTLLRRVWSTGVLFVRPANGDHRFDLWPRAPGGRRLLPPRLSKRSLDALVALARSASWRVPTTWGTHVGRVLDRPPLEAIPAIKSRLGRVLRRHATDDKVKPLSALSACHLSLMSCTYQEVDSAGRRISGATRKPTRRSTILVKRRRGVIGGYGPGCETPVPIPPASSRLA